MADVLRAASVYNINSEGKLIERFKTPTIFVICSYDPQGLSVKIVPEYDESHSFEFPFKANTDTAKMGSRGQIISLQDENLCIVFNTDSDVRKFRELINTVKGRRANSVFSQRTEESSANQYFQFYGYLSQQQNMMQDFVRTSTYQKAIHSNINDFHNKIVLDVGAGSGILSFFAVQAGAQLVYAVEASNMAQYAEMLVNANHLSDKIVVIAGKIEEIDLPQEVDIIISEPMGYMLYNERMLETYLHARKWLKPGGKMFPSRGDLHVAPFTDEALYLEQFNKASFWYQTSFHGVDLSRIRTAAMKEYFRQPIVDTFDIRICMAKSVRHVVDFLSAEETDLHRIDIPLEFHILETGTCHGLAFWFDVAFTGSTQQIWLSTSPTEPLTHWYQVRCLLQTPIFAKEGQMLTGRVLLAANNRQSYDVTMELKLEGTSITSSNTFDLKNPYFRYTGATAPPPPGNNTTSPSEAFWTQLDAQGARNAVNLVNGISVNGLGEASMDIGQPILNTNLIGLGNQSNIIHPGCIPSTGRVQNSMNSSGGMGNSLGTGYLPSSVSAVMNMVGGTSNNFLSTSTLQQQNLINGAIYRPK
ncbi:histone-arginine methyltransferase CARMER [Phlebotomus papatasi]|uniref:histone-arginine methyltransferase CARMER n=1 Tax=Phlebotomus papatasi TaxID=29031 RepID=UPI002484736D|nr:histone-arginine methyltransferase CARMER [Phlebotomus papatasi]